MKTTGEQIRKVKQVASAILALVILAVLAGILWMSGMEDPALQDPMRGKTQAPGLQDPMQGQPQDPGVQGQAPATNLQEESGYSSPNRTASEAALPGVPGAPATPSANVQVIPVPPPGQLDYLAPDSVSSPEPRSKQAGQFDT
ncbi:MAG: hypothetical protein ACOX9B_06495 [Candidatus Xenobium sp.]|jgi:hypothetical protein|nr:hypothetical protein [Burkholderiales bacterium]